MLDAIFSDLEENERVTIYVRDLHGTLLETLQVSSAKEIRIVSNKEYSFDLEIKTDNPLNISALQVEIPYDNVHEKSEAIRVLHEIVIPPTFVVDAVYSIQTYWLLTKRINSDAANSLTELIRVELNAPILKTRNIVPGSQVAGALERKQSTLIRNSVGLRFSSEDLRLLLQLTKANKHAINTVASGEEAGWSVSLELRDFGISREGIKTLFAEKPVGGRSTKHLLSRKANDSIKLTRIFFERDDCYFVNKRGSSEIVSTFVFEPLLLLEGEQEDTFIGNIRSQGTVWENVRLPKSAFSSGNTLLKQLGRASWAWLGTDKEVRYLLPHITAQWEMLGGEKSLATSVIGRHGNFWVTPDAVLDQDGILDLYNSSILYVDSGRTAPNVTFAYIPDDDELVRLLKPLAANIQNLNVEFVLWPMLGWFMATPFKPLLRSLRIPFPHLAIYGSTGAGKTSTIESIFMPLIGYKEPAHSHDCDTTSYALMALMSSTNAVPISLAEFRQSLLGVHAFKALRRMLLLAYDSAEDTRGTADQYTIEYKYTAPIVLSGEDIVSDKAIRRRTIIISMNPLSVREAKHQEAFAALTRLPLNLFASRYIQYTLEQRLTTVKKMLNACYDEIGIALPNISDNRVKRNYAIVLLGTKFFQRFLARHNISIDVPGANFLDPAFSEIQNVALQRGYLMIDEFIVDLINVVTNATDEFPYRIDNDGRVLWFQLRKAYDWWRKFRLQRRLEVFSYRAISAELRELRREATNPNSYIMSPRNMSRFRCTRLSEC